MPTKKNSRKPAKRKKPVAKKAARVKKIVKKKPAAKAPQKKRIEKRKPAPKKSVTKTKVAGRKKAVAPTKVVRQTTSKPAGVLKKRASRESQTFDAAAPGLQEQRSQSAGQSGDLQGLSRREGADSESVDELLEEGNAFEAEVVSGVENADDADEREVHTHEVPEDDVPEEYLDEE